MIIWPFAVRSDGPNPGQEWSGQWRRIDQGQDLQADAEAPSMPNGVMPVLAQGAGIVRWWHDPNGFGQNYPVLYLDTPIDDSPNAPIQIIYYGHVYPTVADNIHVAQGDEIAHTLADPGGGAAGLAHWLENGIWDPANDGPLAHGTAGATVPGQHMHDLLLHAPVWGAPPPPPPPPPTTVGDNVTRHPINVSTDANGNGWADLSVPFDSVVSIFTNAADPQASSAYTPIARVAGLAEGAGTRVVLEGGPVSGVVEVIVMTASP